MSKKIHNWWKSLLGGLLALLGFEGCEEIIHIGYCEYGQPHANYKLMGDVKNEAGKPVKGIRVVFAPMGLEDEDLQYENDTLFTDANGRFELEQTRYNWPGQESGFVLVAEDVDGEENGAFASQTLKHDQMDIKQSEKGDGNWYDGSFDIEAHFVLKKKDQ